jgi:hypothetical protein
MCSWSFAAKVWVFFYQNAVAIALTVEPVPIDHVTFEGSSCKAEVAYTAMPTIIIAPPTHAFVTPMMRPTV